MALDTIAARTKRRKLPVVDTPRVSDDQLRRSLEAIREHLRMYEGDSGAPKERFVTIAELEKAGIIGTKVQGNFALIDSVLGGDVAQGQQSGSGGDTVIINEGDTVTGATTLAGLTDTNVSGAVANSFLQLSSGKWVGKNLYGSANTWTGLNTFKNCMRVAGVDAGYVDFCHDNTDLNITGNATTDVNLVGLNLSLGYEKSIVWFDQNTNRVELLSFVEATGNWPAITSFSYTSTIEFNVSTSSSFLVGLLWNNDGTRLYFGDDNGGTVDRIGFNNVAFTTPYIPEAITDRATEVTNVAVGDASSRFRESTWNSDGTSMWIADYQGTGIEEWTNTGAPYNPDSTSELTDAATVLDTGVNERPTSIDAKADGTRIWVCIYNPSNQRELWQYTLSVADDLTTATKDIELGTGTLSQPVGGFISMKMSPAGDRFWVMSSGSDQKLYEYETSTPYDITSPTYVGVLDVNNGNSRSAGTAWAFEVSPDGSSLIVGTYSTVNADTEIIIFSSSGGAGGDGLFVGDPNYVTQIDGSTTTITGDAVVDGTATVAGAATLNSSLSVAGATSLTSTLGVTGTADFDGNVDFNNSILSIFDSTGLDSAILSHNGTDFVTVFTQTQNWNITGLSGYFGIEHDTTGAQLVVQPISPSGQDAEIEIRGARNSPAAATQVAGLLLSTYDNDIASDVDLARITSETVVGSDTNLNSQKLAFYYRDNSALDEGLYLYNNEVVVPGQGFKVTDSTEADWALFSHNGTDFNTTFQTTADWNITGLTGQVDIDTEVAAPEFWADSNFNLVGAADSGVFAGYNIDSNAAVVSHLLTGAIAGVRYGNNGDINFYADSSQTAGTTSNKAMLIDAAGAHELYGSLSIIDPTSRTDQATFSHDGTDFNTTFLLTTDWNITGQANTRLAGNLVLSTNANYLYGTTSTGGVSRIAGINAGDVCYLGPIDNGPTNTVINVASTSTICDIYSDATLRGRFSSSGLLVYQGFRLYNGSNHYLYDSTNTDYQRMYLDGTDANWIFFQCTDINLTGLGGHLWIRDGAGLKISDSLDTSFVTFNHNGTDFDVVGTSTSGLDFQSFANAEFRDGCIVRIRDAANTNWTQIDSATVAGHGGFWAMKSAPAVTNYSLLASSTDTFLNAPTGGTVATRINNSTVATVAAGIFAVNAGNELRIQDSTDADWAAFSHDGTDFNTAFGGLATADWNITGLTGRIISAHDVIITNTSPELHFRDTDATLDEKNWIVRGDGDLFRIQTATDAAPDSGAANAFYITRTGTIVNEVRLGGYRFDVDQTLGAGLDNYVLTYDDALGTIQLEAAAGGGPSAGTTTDSMLRWDGAAWSETTRVRTTSAGALEIRDSTGIDSVSFTHDGIDLKTDFATTTDWDIGSITPLTGTMSVYANFAVRGTNPVFRVHGGLTPYIQLSHDGTDANIDVNSTTDLNINDGVKLKLWNTANSQATQFETINSRLEIDPPGSSVRLLSARYESNYTGSNGGPFNGWNGALNDTTNAYQMVFSYQAETTQRHAIRTQHDGLNPGNTFDFILHDYNNADTALPSIYAFKIGDEHVDVRAGLDFRVLDSSNTDFVAFTHDGTDFNVAATNTESMNFTGFDFWEVPADVGLTADAGSAQGNGVITSSYNVYSTVATAGDAATLPATFGVGRLVYVKNDGASSMDVFPASGDDAGAGTNTAVAVAAGDFAVFMGTVADTTWTKIMGGTA